MGILFILVLRVIETLNNDANYWKIAMYFIINLCKIQFNHSIYELNYFLYLVQVKVSNDITDIHKIGL